MMQLFTKATNSYFRKKETFNRLRNALFDKILTPPRPPQLILLRDRDLFQAFRKKLKQINLFERNL